MHSSPPTSHPTVAVIGCGYWGKNLVRNFHELGALRLICDKNETLLALFKEKYPGVEACLAFNPAGGGILNRDDIQAVVIATPAETHFSMIREVLLAGMHVYVEKPLSLREEEGKEVVDLSDQRGLTLMVGHLLQYHPAFARLKGLVKQGDLGRINYIYSHRLNLGKIRREENILWSFAPHDISMILSLAGEEPESVFATGGNYLHRRIADVTTTHMEFPSGLRAHIFVSWLHPFKDQKLVVVGDRKMAVFDDTAPWSEKLLLYPHEIVWKNNIPVPAEAQPERVELPEAEPLRLQCEHFLACIANGHRPLTDGHEGLRVLKILNASQHSLDSNGKKILVKEGKTDPSGRIGRSVVGIEGDEFRGASGPEGPTPRRDDRFSSAESAEEKVGVSLRQSAVEERVFVHETAIIDDNVSIGGGTRIWHFSHVLSGSKIGENCNIGQNVVIGPDVTIGNGCKIQNNVSIYKGVTLEDEVFCARAWSSPTCIIPERISGVWAKSAQRL